MMRWLKQYRFWAALIGTTAAVGLAWGHGGMDAPPGPAKKGDVISLKFSEGQDRQFKVLSVEKQADGSFQYELKDTKTGETITLVDRDGGLPVTQPAPQKTKEQAVPKLNLGPLPTPQSLPAAVPTYTPPPATLPIKPESTQNKNGTQSTTSGATTMPDTPQDPPKKPGLLARIFGSKKTPPTDNSNKTNTTTAPSMAPAVAPPSYTMPPQVRPTPGLFPSTSGGGAEPPRVLPIQPVAPPPAFQPSAPPLFTQPLVPSAPTLIPSAPPPVAPKPPTLMPNPPAPMVPGLPTIPIPPSGMSSSGSPIIQAGYLSPASTALVQEIRPYVLTLRNAMAASERIFAMQALAGCRHASSDIVKKVIFQACISDPCPLVRACCIDELCKLGYYDLAFLNYLKIAYEDPSDDVHEAAKEALKKMTPKR